MRIGAAAVVLLLAGATAGAWADRTGAVGLGSSDASLLGCAVVAVLAILCAALPTRATAVLALLVAVLGAVGTLLVALVLAPNGGSPVATTPSGLVAGFVAGFAGVGLLLVLCGADVARWRTDLANPVSTAVASVVSVLCGGALVAGAVLIASRLSGEGTPPTSSPARSPTPPRACWPGRCSWSSSSGGHAAGRPAALLGRLAARLLGGGRPVRLGAVASGLLALAGALASSPPAPTRPGRCSRPPRSAGCLSPHGRARS